MALWRKKYGKLSRSVIPFQHHCHPCELIVQELRDTQNSDGDLEDCPSPTSSAGSLSGLDVIDEDFNRSEISRGAGFVGKNSEISWLQALDADTERHVIERDESDERPDGDWPHDDDNSVASKTYHANEDEIFEPEQLDPYGVPPKHVADAYYSVYLESVGPSFPIIREPLFSAQYRRFYATETRNPGDKWLCILNLIFAIAARHRTLAGRPVHGGLPDYVFFSRAKALSANEALVFNHPDLQQVQVEALLAFYFVTRSQINR